MSSIYKSIDKYKGGGRSKNLDFNKSLMNIFCFNF